MTGTSTLTRWGVVGLVLAGTPAIADTINVPDPGNGIFTIQDGIDAAMPGDEVVVADGTYTGVRNRGLTLAVDITLRSAGGAGACAIDCEALGPAMTITADATVIGFTITNGFTEGLGGAILVDGFDATIDDCVFAFNQAVSDGTGGPFNPFSGNGGAIAFTGGGGGEVIGSVFCENRAEATGAGVGDILSGVGGAIQVGSGSEVLVSDCLFDGNVAVSPGIAGNGFGGAISTDLFNSAPALLTVVDSTFTGNSASIAGGGIWIFGGHTVLVESSVFEGNSGQSAGAVAFQVFTDLVIRECDFEGNFTLETITFGTPDVQEQIGGGAVAGGTNSTLLIEGSSFTGNASLAGRGGAVSLIDDSTATLIGCYFSGNQAALAGGGVANAEAPAVAPFSDGDTFPSTMQMIDCLVMDNIAQLGAGAANLEGSSLSATGCDFQGNSAVSDGEFSGNGGAIFCQGDLLVDGCSFSGNTAVSTDGATATALGGAIIVSDDTEGTVIGSSFDGNAAVGPGTFGNSFGGAIFVGESTTTNAPSNLTVETSTFTGNTAAFAGGAIWVQGIGDGGVVPSELSLSGCMFDGNSAQSGGAVFGFLLAGLEVTGCQFLDNYTFADLPPFFPGGGALGTGLFMTPTVSDCLFEGNACLSGRGGAIFNAGNVMTIVNSEFRGNEAAAGGGAISNDASADFFAGPPSAMTMDNCLVACNSTDALGGGILNTEASSVTMVNVTLAHNFAWMDGGGLANMMPGSTADVTNGILWGNESASGPGGAQILDGPMGVTATWSIVQRGWMGVGNLKKNPRWVDASEEQCPNGNDYRLSRNSPAIDAGDDGAVTVFFDLDGNLRIVGDAVDMGAYEFDDD